MRSFSTSHKISGRRHNDLPLCPMRDPQNNVTHFYKNNWRKLIKTTFASSSRNNNEKEENVRIAIAKLFASWSLYSGIITFQHFHWWFFFYFFKSTSLQIMLMIVLFTTFIIVVKLRNAIIQVHNCKFENLSIYSPTYKNF